MTDLAWQDCDLYPPIPSTNNTPCLTWKYPTAQSMLTFDESTGR